MVRLVAKLVVNVMVKVNETSRVKVMITVMVQLTVKLMSGQVT